MNSIYSKYKNNQKILNNLVLISIITFFVQYVLKGGWQHHPDSYDYIQGVSAVLHGYDWYDSAVALRPGFVYLSLPFTIFLDHENSLGLQNFLLYLAIGPLMFFYTKKIVSDDKLSYYSAVFLVTSFPIMYWGLSILNDMGSWFFFLLSSYVVILVNEKATKSLNYVFAGLISGFGIVYKTNVVACCFFFTLLLVFNKPTYSKLQKVKALLTFGICSLIPLALNQIYIWRSWELDYYNLFILPLVFGDGLDYESFDGMPVSFKFTQTYRLLTFFIAFPLLPLALFIFYKIWNDNDFANSLLKDSNSFKYLSFLFLSTLLVVIGWGSDFNRFIGSGSPRYAFQLFPVIIPLVVVGVNLIIARLEHYGLKRNSVWFFFLFINASVSSFISIYGTEVRDFFGFWT